MLDSAAARALALSLPGHSWAEHGVRHPLGDDFSGAQDLVAQKLDEECVLSSTKDVPVSLLKDVVLTGTPAEVVEQAAVWRDHGVRYLVANNVSVLQPKLTKAVLASAPFFKLLRGLKKL